MEMLKVQNFGPIKNGFNENEGFIEFKNVTLFIGNQGSGKSTIAKLFSTLSWIEKALVRKDFTEKFIMQYNRFKKQLAYQNLGNYLSDDTYIEYRGYAFCFIYENSQFTVTPTPVNAYYHFPKIMYVPAERNFVSSVDRPDLVKRLPLPLYTFMDEYEEAKQRINENIILPIGDTSFEYKKNNKKSFLVGAGFKIELLEASSGFQSLVPLFIVTRHLSDIIKNKVSENRKSLNREEEEKIREEVEKLFENQIVSEDVMRVVLSKISSRYKYECFINIVEEPEQNLFPESQKAVLFELLRYKNENSNNKLIITTHSPYLINYISIAIQADYLKARIMESEASAVLIARLSEIISLEATVMQANTVVYELKDGNILKLPNPDGIPSDKNYLNQQLAECNKLFDALLEIEQEL